MYLDEVLWDTPAGYWRLGESSGTTANDSSGNGRNGSYVGSPTLAQPGALVGDPDTAVAFNGSTQYVNVATWTVWGGVSSLSFECWVYLAPGATEKYVGWRNGQVDFRVGTTSIAFGLNTSSYTVFRVNLTVTANVWHHVAWTYDGSTQRIYLDGIEVGSTAKTGAVATGTGALQLAGTASAGSLAGTLDEVAAYATALAASRVRRHYFEGLAAKKAPKLRAQVAFASNPGDTPTWTDISDYVQVVSTRRGRQHELGRMETGTATITLDNRDRRFDPTYTAGPYYPNIVPARRVRVSALWAGTWYYLFDGYAESWLPVWPAGMDAKVNLTATDGMKLISAPSVSGSWPEELSSARVARVLDAIGWPAADRSIETGKSDVQAAAVAEKALEHLQKVADSENGLVFVDGQGRVVFHNRHHRIVNQDSPQGTFGDASGELPYLDLKPNYDDSEIWNDVRLTRVGGTEQTASDSTSQQRYLTRTLERSGLLITTDAEALDAARWLLGRYAEPDIRFESLTVDGRVDDALWPLVLGLEFGDRIVIRRRPPGGGNTLERHAHVEGVQHDISPSAWTTTWQLSPANPQSGWMLDSQTNSVLDTSTKLAY